MSSAPTSRIHLLLVDDSEVVRTGLRTLLSAEPGIQVVGEAASAAAGIEAAVRLKPHVVLLDVRLPDGSGLDACQQILRRAPDSRVLILTSVVDDTLVEAAIRAGASGYLLKEIDPQGLRNAIREVAAGRSVLDPAVTARVLQLVRTSGSAPETVASLSAQEKRVLAAIADGCTNKEVATRLGLSEKTVRNYVAAIFAKLHVSRRAEAAVLYAQDQRRQS